MARWLQRRLAVLGGGDPTDPLESDNKIRHVAVGMLLITVAGWALVASTAAFHSNLKASWPLAVVGGVLIAVVIFSIDLLITATPLKDGRLGSRLALLAVRGSVSIAMGLVISHATILFMYRDTLTSMVSAQNQKEAAALTESLTASSKWTPIINAAQDKATKDEADITAANTTLTNAQQRLSDLQKAWSDDEVCVHGRMAANGDTCGPGPSSNALKKNYETFRDQTLPGIQTNHAQQVQALTADEKTQAATVTDDSAKRAADINDAVKATLANTGLAAQTDALIRLLQRDLSAWLWPLFFIVIDLAVALMKAILPESDFDRARRARRQLTDQVNAALSSHQGRFDAVVEHAATRQAEIAMARIDRDAERQLAAIRADPPIHFGPKSRRLAYATAAALAVALLLGLAALPGHHTSAAGDPRAGAGQSMTLRDGLALQVPPGAVSGNAPVTAGYPAARPWTGHTAVSARVQLETTGTLVGQAQLSLTVPADEQQAAQSGLLLLAFESNDPAGWTAYPATYDPATHRMVGALTHFSTWQFWTWDWVGIAADMSQTLGQLTGRRASAVPSCDTAKLPTPGWYNSNAGITPDPAMVVRSCVQGHKDDDVLDVQLVNNRPYGLMVHYNGAPIQYGGHPSAGSLPNVFRDVIGDVSAGSNGLYLPPLTSAWLGIKNLGANANHTFSITPTSATITADVFDAVAGEFLDKAIEKGVDKWAHDVFAAAATKDCSAVVRSIGDNGIPDQATVYRLLTGDTLKCITDILTIAARNEIAKGDGMDLATIGKLSDRITAMSKFLAVKKIADVEGLLGNLLDFGVDKKYAAVAQLGFGFQIVGHFTYTRPAATPTTPAPTTDAPGTTRPAPPTTAPPPGTAPPSRVTAYDNYGPVTQAGIPMCAGDPTRPESMPGGTVTQTFVVPSGVAYLDTATVQIDINHSMTVHAALAVNGTSQATDSQIANNDTTFTFAKVRVRAGDSVALSLTWTATQGKLDTIYLTGSPANGHLTITNTCSDGARSYNRTDTGLRATVSGWSS